MTGAKKLLALLVFLASAGVWYWRLAPTHSPTPDALRQTAGITVEVLSTRLAPPGVAVTCRVGNATSNTAEQVVLRVAVTDDHDTILAVNPLASLTGLAAGQSSNATFRVPLTSTSPNLQARVSVSLVRWQP